MEKMGAGRSVLTVIRTKDEEERRTLQIPIRNISAILAGGGASMIKLELSLLFFPLLAHSSQQMGSIAVYLFLRAMDGLLLLLLLLPP
jgi:hypothetical protein